MHMTSAPLGSRIATRLDEANIVALLADVAEQVSQSYYLFLPHPSSLTSYAAAPQAAPTFVEVVVDFALQQVRGYTIVSPAVAWRADGSSGSHQAAEMIAAEFRYAVRQVDAGSYELAEDDLLPGGTGPGFESTDGAAAFTPATHRYAETAPAPHLAPAAPLAPPPVAPVAPATPFIPAVAAPPAMPAAPVPSSSPPPVAPAPPTAPAASAPLALHLLTPDGRRAPLTHATIVGRAPAARADSPGAALLPLADPGRLLSKTHALIEFDGQALWVTDLGSTNGTSLIGASGTEPCAPHVRTQIAPGSKLSLGGVEVSFGSR